MGVSHLFVMQFLSTPSARRATPLRRYCKKTKRISIHALREEGDAASELHTFDYWKFLSTPSARRATKDFLRLLCGH